MTANENQIVVYRPNATVRLDVRLENETVWLTQAQLCELFGVVKSNVSYHRVATGKCCHCENVACGQVQIPMREAA